MLLRRRADLGLAANDLLVLMGIIDHLPEARPSVRLAELTDLSESTVKRRIEALEARGLLGRGAQDEPRLQAPQPLQARRSQRLPRSPRCHPA